MEKSRYGILTGEPALPLIVRVINVSGVSSGYPRVTRLWNGKKLNDSLPWEVTEQLQSTVKLQVAETRS